MYYKSNIKQEDIMKKTKSISIQNNKVYRPKGFWTPTIHRLLTYLQNKKFHAVPKVFGIADDCEILSYMEGDIYNYPLTGAIASAEALCSAAVLLRQYHDATVSFLQENQFEDLKWLLPTKEPQEVICHGDFAPYNVSLNENIVVGIFDFDTAHPAPRIWDIAYAVYCWAPFKTDPYDTLGNLKTQSICAKQFCDSYGLSQDSRIQLVDMMIIRLQELVNFMQKRADEGDEKFQKNLQNGHHLAYQKDIDYLEFNKEYIVISLRP